MLRLTRMALQFVLFLLLLSVAIAIGAAETGVAEKIALLALAAALVFAAVHVRRIGAGGGTQPLRRH